MISDAGPSCCLSGRVLTSGGAPHPAAVLTLCDSDGAQVARTGVASCGSYALTAPRAGSYLLLGQAPGHCPHAQVLGLTGPREGHEVRLERLTAQIVGEVRAFPSGAPIAGAVVVATDLGGEVCDSTRSGADGRYALGGLAQGPHTVTGAAEHMWPAAVAVHVPGSGRSITCDLDMLEPIRPPAGLYGTGEPGVLPARWAAAKADAPVQAPTKDPVTSGSLDA